MISQLKTAAKIVGVKQLKKALNSGLVSVVYLADDADPMITEPLLTMCRESSIPVTAVSTMVELGKACGIDVGASAAGLLK